MMASTPPRFQSPDGNSLSYDDKGRTLMKKKIGMTMATLFAAGAIGLTGVASADSSAAREITSVKCPSVCPFIFQPVTCKMSNGTVRTFSNRCFAGVYACQHYLTIISCRPADVPA
jgi:hypothetical protein